MEEGRLTFNFRYEEFKCRCGKCDGSIPERYEENLYELATALQNLRYKLRKPIIITSGYRCLLHPLTKARPNSWHRLGGAADIKTEEPYLGYLTMLAEKEGLIGGLGFYPEEGFIHVDIRPVYSRWVRLGGKYITLSSISREGVIKLSGTELK